ncbi:MAG: protoporphyrinogen/coproporphyrinogen oxidase [Spirochaetia bacterium]
MKTIIVGGGCAGLSAAYTLKKSEIDFTLYEASPHPGGRCRTVYEDGYQFHSGAGSTEPQWETTFRYLEELGLTDRLYSIQKQRYAFNRNGRRRTVYLGGDFGDMLKATGENLSFLFSAFPLKTYLQLLRVFSALKKYMRLLDSKNHNFRALAEIGRKTTEEFVLEHGGPEALDWVFHPFLSTMVFGRPRDISIAHPISLFSLMKGMRSLEGGMGAVTSALYDRVRSSVELSTPVEEIIIEGGKVRGVRLERGDFIESDHVICAVDAVDARRVLPGAPETIRRPLEACTYSSTYYYHFGLENHFLPADTDFFVQMIPAGEDTILAWMAKGSHGDEKPVMIVATRGWEDHRLSSLSEENRRRTVIDEVRRFFPEFPEEPPKTKLFRWNRAVNLVSPAQFEAIQKLLDNHMDDVQGLYLAGEYLFPIACTEGAFATGKRAAKEITRLTP